MINGPRKRPFLSEGHVKILGEKYSKNELIFAVYALASSRCLEALGLKNIDAIISSDTTNTQKRDFCTMFAQYLKSMEDAVAKGREKHVIDSMAATYAVMAQTGLTILNIAAQEKELKAAAEKSKVTYHASESDQ